jgi:tetratricopeptide (TPR) repeat protein
MRATFRSGLLDMEENNFSKALGNLKKVNSLDPNFMQLHMLMKMGECCYKSDDCVSAVSYFKQAEECLKPKFDYLIELFLGKCHDKMKMLGKAIENY